MNMLASQRVSYYTMILAGLTGALSALGCVQIIFLIRADRTANVSANAALKAANALPSVERAYVFLHYEVMSNIVVIDSREDIRRIDEGFVSYSGGITFNLINHGKTPALITHTDTLLDCSDFGDPPRFEGVFPRTISIVIAPTEKWERFVKLDLIEPDRLKRALEGRGKITLSGRVCYDDVFGQPHETGFCWEYDVTVQRFVQSNTRTLNYHH